MMWAVLPVKSLGAAKQRLAPLFAADERRMLARAMFSDVLAACARARTLSGVMVVTADPEVVAIAAQAGARVLPERHEQGTNPAVQAGMRALTGRASGIIVLPADVPQVTGSTIDAAVALCRHQPSLVLVEASRDGGKNLLGCAPPDLIAPSFGCGSFVRHRASAAAACIEPLTLGLGELDLDLDGPDDLTQFLALATDTRTDRVLRELGAPLRLGALHACEPA
jgi:2-phospho-L-lactate/phosphoenolpyruvate guanylyltransferase